MMDIFIFLSSVFAISLFSGAMSPGPMTAAVLAMGVSNRHAGLGISLGHGIIEIPLIVLIVLGFDKVLNSPQVKLLTGFAGGIVLLWMGVQILRNLNKAAETFDKNNRRGPVLTGVILSASNPYFLLWWATIGLKLAIDARTFGLGVFLLFIIAHWLCDYVWLEILSLASFKGSVVLGPKAEKIMLIVCGAALILFSIKFIYNTSVLWVN